MFDFIRRIRSRRAAAKLLTEYRSFATAFGNACSYSYLGVPGVTLSSGKRLDYSQCIEYLDKLEEKYASLGYRIIPIDSWIGHGGYDQNIDHLFFVKRSNDEKPIFTKNQMRAEEDIYE